MEEPGILQVDGGILAACGRSQQVRAQGSGLGEASGRAPKTWGQRGRLERAGKHAALHLRRRVPGGPRTSSGGQHACIFLWMKDPMLLSESQGAL